MDKNMEKLKVLIEENSYFSQILAELRDDEVQKDRLRFRFNLERAGTILAYEISKMLPYREKEVTTPLGQTSMQLPSQNPVLCSILRAALPLHNGMIKIFDKADNAFVSAYRHHTAENKFEIKVEYLATPNLEDRLLILSDTMIATGQSIIHSYQAVIEQTVPKEVIVCCVIASEAGIDYVRKHLPRATIIAGAIDGELTAKSYIVPGLGDAGDLAFGSKDVNMD